MFDMNGELAHLFLKEQQLPARGPCPMSTEDASFLLMLGLKSGASCESILLAMQIRLSAGPTVPSNKCTSRQAAAAVSLVLATKYVEGLAQGDVQKMLLHTSLRECDLPRLELSICERISWNLSLPNPLSFLRGFSHDADGWNHSTRSLAKELLLALIIDPVACSSYPASTQGAAALWLSKSLLKMGSWTLQHRVVCGLKEADLQPCVSAMIKAARRAAQHIPTPFSNFHASLVARLPGP
jgi:cyclin-like protein